MAKVIVNDIQRNPQKTKVILKTSAGTQKEVIANNI